MYMGERRDPTKRKITKRTRSTSTRRALYARGVPATDMVKTMGEYHEDDANKEEEGGEEEEDNGESDVNDDLDGFEVLCKAIVVVAHTPLGHVVEATAHHFSSQSRPHHRCRYDS